MITYFAKAGIVIPTVKGIITDFKTHLRLSFAKILENMILLPIKAWKVLNKIQIMADACAP